MLSGCLSDLRQGTRALLARPTFTVVVVLTLSLGIGANVAILALAEQILFRPLPVPEPDQLVTLTDPGTDAQFVGRTAYVPARRASRVDPMSVLRYE